LIQLIDKIDNFSINTKSNVSRETLPKTEEIKKQNVITDDVPRETYQNIDVIEEPYVPRETLEKNNGFNKKNDDKLDKIKNIRINNILKESTKQDINFIVGLWNNINDYLIDEKYKMVAGILKNSKAISILRIKESK